MTGSTLIETLRRHWRGMLYWSIGFAIYGFYSTLLVPDMAGLQQYVRLMETMPSGLLQAFGLQDTSVIASPEGFIAFSYHVYIILFIGVYAVLSGLNVTANDEDSGVMDILLSLPVPRWQIVLEKFLAYWLMIIVIVVAGHIGLVLGAQSNPYAQSVDNARLIEGSINILPSAVLMLAFTVFIATVVRRRSTAAAIAGVFVVGSFLLETVGSTANSDFANALRNLSFIHHYNSLEVIKNGLAWDSMIVLKAAGVLLLAAGMVVFQRRDIAV
jgi:ABC-2 type transport system permease protein